MTHPRKISANNMSSLNTNQSPQQLKPQRGKEHFRKRENWVKVPTIASFAGWVQCWWWLGAREDGEDTAHGKCRDFLKKNPCSVHYTTFSNSLQKNSLQGSEAWERALQFNIWWHSKPLHVSTGDKACLEYCVRGWAPHEEGSGMQHIVSFAQVRKKESNSRALEVKSQTPSDYCSKSRNLWWCWAQNGDLWVEIRAALASCSLSVPAFSLFWEFCQLKIPAHCVSRF